VNLFEEVLPARVIVVLNKRQDETVSLLQMARREEATCSSVHDIAVLRKRAIQTVEKLNRLVVTPFTPGRHRAAVRMSGLSVHISPLERR
jgi:hypothetical protein